MEILAIRRYIKQGSVGSKKWNQTGGRTGGQTDGADYITFRVNAVTKDCTDGEREKLSTGDSDTSGSSISDFIDLGVEMIATVAAGRPPPPTLMSYLDLR